MTSPHTAENLLTSSGAQIIEFRFTRPIYRVSALLGISGGADRMIAYDSSNNQIASIVGDDSVETITTTTPIARVVVEDSGTSTTPTIDNLVFTGGLVVDASPTSTPQTFTIGDYVAGTEFTIDVPLTVRSLGWLDAEGNGLTNSHRVGLWNVATQGLITEAVVTPSSSFVPSAHPTARWYLASIGSVTLPAGTYRVAGEVNGDNIALSGNKVGVGGTTFPGLREDRLPQRRVRPRTSRSRPTRCADSVGPPGWPSCRPDLTTTAIPGSPGYACLTGSSTT